MSTLEPVAAAPVSLPKHVVLSVPLELPSMERVEQIIREAALQVAEQRLAWLTFRESAAYLKMPFRTFERKKKECGLPVAEIDGVKRIARQDLDALMLAHLKSPGTTIIRFPSQEAAAKLAGAA